MPLPIPVMSTPVASGSRVPPWPIFTSRRWWRRRLRWNWLSRSRRARSSSNHGLKVLEGLKCFCKVRITSAEVTPCGLWTAIGEVRSRSCFSKSQAHRRRLRGSSRQTWFCEKVGSLEGMASGEMGVEPRKKCYFGKDLAPAFTAVL